ncbi:MAG: PP2C family protein-serine/threonine phosphatase, partial [Thermoflexus sp.]
MAQGTHPGLSGKNNEDAVETAVLEGPNGRRRYLMVVADGIGGHASGEIASHMVIRSVVDSLRHAWDRPLLQAMTQAIAEANRLVF